MTKHKLIGMSDLHRALQCKGSIYMKTKFPQQESSEKAKEGTAFHDIVEPTFTDYLFNGFSLEESLKIHKDKCWDDEMRRHVEDVCKEMQRQLKAIGPERIGKIGLEEKVQLAEDIGGTADFAYIVKRPAETVLVIWDFKYGTWEVKVETEDGPNPQLAGYVACANATEGWGPVDRAVVHIYQPRFEHPEGPLRRTKLDKKQIAEWTEKILTLGKDVALELERQAPTFCPGDHCKFCPGDGNCAAQLKTAEVVAGVEFLPEKPQEKPAVLNSALLTLEQKQGLVLYRKEFEKLLKEVSGVVLDEINNKGVEYPLLKLVKATTKRVWKNDVEDIVQVLEGAGMEKPYTPKLCTFTAVTKALGKKQADEILGEWAEKPEGATQVVPATDRRKALVPQNIEAIEEFKNENSTDDD